MSASTQLNYNTPARSIGYGVVQALARSVSYSTLNIGTADSVLVGTLPSGAFITDCHVRIDTIFNAVTTNVLTVGTSSGSNADLVAAADVDEATAATTQVLRGIGLSVTSDTPIYVKYTQTGTAATTGAATIIVSYVVP